MTLGELRECVDLLEELAPVTTRKRRMQEVERLTDEYIAFSGRTPSDDLLARMTDVILHEELSDKRPDKMTLEEYPIMSDRQYEKRTVPGKRSKRKDGTSIMEVPLSQARNRGLDGKDYNLPIRRF